VQLDCGHIRANVAVAQSLFRKATSDSPQSVTAAIFRLKTRAIVKLAQSVELRGGGGWPSLWVTAAEFMK